MNNYEREWFKKWFSNKNRLIGFRKLFSKKSHCRWNGTYSFRYNYPPNSPWTKKDTSFIEISKHKIDQALKEMFNYTVRK